MKAGTVGVDGSAAGPVGQPAVDAVEWLEPPLQRGLRHDREKVAGVQPSFARDRALLVGREPLDLPLRQEDVGEGVRRASEDISSDPRPAFGAIEVDDVRELVREEQAQPVVRLRVRSRRRDRVEDHGVVRHRRRVAVEQLGLIGEHDLRPARGGHAQPPLERAPGVLGDDGQALREPVLALVEVDDEMLGRKGAEAERGIEERGAARGAPAGEQEDDGCGQRACAAPHHRGAADADGDSRAARERKMHRISAGRPRRPAPMKKSP